MNHRAGSKLKRAGFILTYYRLKQRIEEAELFIPQQTIRGTIGAGEKKQKTGAH